MKNPFVRFKDYESCKREIPLDGIIRSKDIVIDKLVAGYENIVEEEVKSLVWVVERSRLMETYSKAKEVISDLEYTAEDIEEFCYELDSNERLPYLITGPSGIYISALCNHAKETEITLKLNELKRKMHLIGYQLPEGKRLIVEGDMGNFIGTRLEGGELIIEGCVKDWVGAGMRKGKITVRKYAGYHTAEWMMDGEIWVEGKIRGIGKIINGKVYEMGKPANPSYSSSPSYEGYIR
ncbi:MAG: hypothetical protein SVY10_03005 [Thermodesulfobacteriota bacterium]|nr:hypothetical protein [Thermodesulfobacteriota bacterium]